MNLGAFMDPEFPIFSPTLCYLEREDAYLMLHRIKKQDDYNHDKWVGVGGKFERFESPEDCLVREVREETGLKAEHMEKLSHIVTTPGFCTEKIGLYLATGLSQTMGALIPLIFFLKKDNGSPLHLRPVRMEAKPLLQACGNGASELMSNLSLIHI